MTPVSWSFTTLQDPAYADLTPPGVVSMSPAPSSTGVTMTPTASVTFNEPMSGIGASSLTLRVEGTTTNLATYVSYDAATMTATLRPKYALLPGTKYRIVFGSAIADTSGNRLGYVSWVFKTRYSEVYDPARSLGFAAGTYTGYTFSSTGVILSSKSATLTSASSAPAGKRSSVVNQGGGYYYVTAGVWAGYWVKDSGGITPN
jgi:hypothetical protein